MSADDLWSPAVNNWFPGMTPPVWASLTCRQILDSYRFIVTNSG